MNTLSKDQSSSEVIGYRADDRLTPVKDLSKIFPDIDGQLCSRHSTLFGKLKTTFNKLYDNFQPSHYIVVKGNAYIVGKQQDEVQLSMGLQNGIIILVAKTYVNNNIFINGNHIDEQLIFDFKGKLQQGLHELSEEMEKINEAALSDFCVNNLNGGILYIHANIPEGFYNYQNSFLTALFLSMLALNDGLSSITVSEIISKIGSTKLVSQIFLEKQFYDYHNRQLSLMVGQKVWNVPLQKNIKLLFCRLDLALCDIKHSQSNIQQIKQDKNKILAYLHQNYGINSFYQAFEKEEQLKNKQSILKTDANDENDKQGNFYMKLIEAELKELQALCEFSNKKTPIQELMKIKWHIDSKIRRIFSEEVVELVESVQQKTGIKACTIVESEFLMLAVDRNKYTQLICVLRQLLHKGELKSKSCFKLEQQLIENRWSSQDNGIGQKIFVSVPSKGIAIFDPSQSIWFD